MRIFVVENHPDTLAYVARHLRNAGHEVITAQTFAETVRQLSETPSDVLLADLGLPDRDGCSLPAFLGEACPPIAIAMSGRGSAQDRASSLAAGYRDHLVKPFLPDDLDHALNACAI